MKQRVTFKRTETRTYDIDSPEGLSIAFMTEKANGGLLGDNVGGPQPHSIDVSAWTVVKAEPRNCCDLMSKPKRKIVPSFVNRIDGLRLMSKPKRRTK